MVVFGVMKEEIFCKTPWKTLEICPNGNLKFCSNLRTVIGNLNGDIDQAFNSKPVVDFRKRILSGDLEYLKEICKICLDHESCGNDSYRVICNRLCSDEEISSEKVENAKGISILHCAFGNECNLMCSMCGPEYSSRWSALESVRIPKIDLSKILGIIKDNVDSLKLIKFAGGEPLLVPEHRKCLEYLTESGRSQNIALLYTTNFSVPEKNIEDVVEFWEEFSNVTLSLSLDAIGDLGEYCRFGFSWSRFKQNLNTVLERTKPFVRIAPTVHVLNILGLVDIYLFFQGMQKKFGTRISLDWGNLVYTPEDLSLVCLPYGAKAEIKGKLLDKAAMVLSDSEQLDEFLGQIEPILEKLEKNGQEHRDTSRVLSKISRLDQIYQIEYKNVEPDVYSTILKYGR